MGFFLATLCCSGFHYDGSVSVGLGTRNASLGVGCGSGLLSFLSAVLKAGYVRANSQSSSIRNSARHELILG